MDLALFDFDGTITTRDTFRGFIYFSAGRARTAAGSVALAPLLVGYRRGLVSGAALRRASAFLCFRGRSEAEVDALGQRYAETLGAVVRPEVLATLRSHQERGDRVVIVSASLAPYLRPWSAALGVDLHCTELEARTGKLTGCFAGSECAGEEKACRVRAHYDLASFANVYAYGDTAEDHALLALANRRFYRGRELSLAASSSVARFP